MSRVSALIELGTLSESAGDLALLLLPVVGVLELFAREHLFETSVLWDKPCCGCVEPVENCGMSSYFM